MSIQAYMGQIGMQFWSSVPVSLFIALAEWAAFLVFAHSFCGQRLRQRRGLPFQLLFLAVNIFLQFQHFPVIVHSLALLLLCSVYIFHFGGLSWFNAVFEGCIFCLYLELGKSLCRDGLIASGIVRLLPALSPARLNLSLLGLYTLYLVTLSLLLLRRRPRRHYPPITTPQAMGLLFPFLLYLFVRIMQYGRVEQLDELQWFQFDLLQYAVAVCALLVMRSTESLLASQAAQSELRQRQLLMEQKQQQYQIQKDSIEYVNRRYHDLKHYLTGLEAMLARSGEQGSVNAAEVEQFVSTLKREIDPYGSIQRTGNEVMDVLLSQRLQECQAKGIRLVPFIDASRMDMLSVLDLCALFGNAMDNAIEATEQLSDASRKEIHVKIGVSDGFLLLRFQNYYQGERALGSSGFLTTKEDRAAHGYGLSNIASIAEKYGGTLSTECAGQEFVLHILIPLPAETEGENTWKKTS